MLHDEAEDGGLEMLPLAFALGDGDEILAEKHPDHALDREQALRPAATRRPRRLAVFARSSPGSTGLPGMNLSVAGLGVASVWMNMGISFRALERARSVSR